MDYKKLNEELKKYLTPQSITEISVELAQKVSNKRQEQINKLQNKVSKAQSYADKKRRQAFENASNQVKQIRDKIKLILMDKPGEPIPQGISKKFDVNNIKIIKIPFEYEQTIEDNNIYDWAYFGITDDEYWAPVIVFSRNDYYHTWGGYYNIWVGSKYNFSTELPFWKTALNAVEQKYKDSEEDLKTKDKKLKRKEYNRKRNAEMKAQKLADSKPFDKFLIGLKDKYGSGYIAQDVYGYTYVYKNKPCFIPTKEGYQGDEEFYEPGYWSGNRQDNIDYESQLNKAYEDQYRKSVPSAEKAIWSF